MGSVRVAIVGVGNCASSLVQGVEYYKDADPASRVPGLMHVQFGPYHVRDIEFVAAFDVDAIKSQVGATITHRVLAKLFEDRGVELLRTYQLNFGGNMDFMNMLERKRLQSKKISKTQSVTSQIPHEMAKADVHIGPSDHVPWLDDRKWAYVRLEGKSFGDTPLNLEYKLEVWDSPNSAGVIIDAVRPATIAKDRGIGGAPRSPSSYLL